MIRHRISREQIERKVALLIQTRAALLRLIGSAIGSPSDHSGSSRSLQRGVSSANAAYFTVARVPEFLVRNRELHLGAADSSRSELNRLGWPRSLGKGDSAKEVVEIDPECVWNIRVELRASGVTESVIYLDLDGLGREMS